MYHFFLSNHCIVSTWILIRLFVSNYLINRIVLFLLTLKQILWQREYHETKNVWETFYFALLNPLRIKSLCDTLFKVCPLWTLYFEYLLLFWKQKPLLSFTLVMTHSLWYISPLARMDNSLNFVFCTYDWFCIFPISYLIYITQPLKTGVSYALVCYACTFCIYLF